jgi:hypothetical protein
MPERDTGPRSLGSPLRAQLTPLLPVLLRRVPHHLRHSRGPVASAPLRNNAEQTTPSGRISASRAREVFDGLSLRA